MNARFALNASNARWGSLYDALYGTDAIPEDGGAERGEGYNKVRGDKVIAFARDFLDEAAPLASGSHVDTTRYAVVDGALQVDPGRRQPPPDSPTPPSSSATAVSRPRRQRCCCATTACTSKSRSTPDSPIGKTDAAGVKDVVLESAVTTIMDFEDSVAAVDADDKVVGLPQLARPDEGRPGRGGQQGRHRPSPAP